MRMLSLPGHGPVPFPGRPFAFAGRHRVLIVLVSMWARALLVAAHVAAAVGLAAVAEVAALSTLGGVLAAFGAHAFLRRYRFRRRVRPVR